NVQQEVEYTQGESSQQLWSNTGLTLQQVIEDIITPGRPKQQNIEEQQIVKEEQNIEEQQIVEEQQEEQ
ncbi:7018_t:CDS:2, partial [Racocetra persica]